MSPDLDPYRVLGLPVGATPRQIRRRYRKLARRHHPDVAADPREAHERFVRIQQAYEILRDPQRRAQWEQKLTGARITVEPVGLRITYREELLARARAALRTGALRRARDLCAEAIELNPVDPEAYRLLGEIFLSPGKAELGEEMLAEARRLEQDRAAEPAPRGPRPPPSAADRRKPFVWVPEPVRVRRSILFGGAAAVAVCLVLMYADAHSELGGASRLPSVAFLAFALAAAFVTGAAGGASGLLGRPDELLGWRAEVRSGKEGTRLGLITVVASIFVHPALGLLIYLAASLLTQESNVGVLEFFGGCFGLTGLCWLVSSHHDSWQFFIPGANLVFLAAGIGWAVGSVFSPAEWWRE